VFFYPTYCPYLKDKKMVGYIYLASLLVSWLLTQNINPINQNSILTGRNISQKASFNTTPTPAVIEATRKNIPMTNIMGIRRMPNISLCITSDTGYLGISITDTTSEEPNPSYPFNFLRRLIVTDV